VDIGDAACELGVAPERVSRLVSKAIALFERGLATLTRRGRPRCDSAAEDRDTELGLTRELLAVASSLLLHVPIRRQAVRVLVVGAWQRLRLMRSMTQARFCQALGLSERTLRAWLQAAPRMRPLPSPAPEPKPPRPRPPRRRRFDFDVTLPGTQIGADTTDLCAFGVPLKLIAAQDIGGRDARLFDSVVVCDHESADRIVDTVAAALRDRPGAQAITDQGTPYMAEATRKALDDLEAEHAPQREGEPTGKATVERAFRTLKDIARPLLALTTRIADKLPALRSPTLATSVTSMLVAALLRAYQHGARAARTADHARGGLSADDLAAVAEQSRDHARATDRSARLLLAHVHELYGLAGAARPFVDSLRRYPVPVLQQAERMLQTQAHRDDIRDRRSYFATLVRRAHEDFRRTRARERLDRVAAAERARVRRAHRAQLRLWRQDPTRWLHHALDLCAMQWLPTVSVLLAGGHGLGLAYIRSALRRLLDLHDPDATRDIAAGVLHAWTLTALDRLGPTGVAAIASLLGRELAAATHPPTPSLPHPPAAATLPLAGLFPRPPPSDRLRN